MPPGIGEGSADEGADGARNKKGGDQLSGVKGIPF